MYDLHTHSLLSDGVLLPSEIAVRYQAAGYKVIAVSDHADYSNIEQVTSAILKFTKCWPKNAEIKVIPGVELTHLPLEQFKPLVDYARKRGIKVIIGHGETSLEPVLKGTNLAALKAGVDILAHPGFISEEEARIAESKGIFLELTSRRGHRDTNNHVAGLALKSGARLILNNDSHLPEDIITPEQLKKVGIDAGLETREIEIIYKNIEKFLLKRGIR